MSELVTCFPMRGAITYRGFSFSITLRQSAAGGEGGALVGDLGMAMVLMDQFIEAHEGGMIDLSQFAVADPADQRPRDEIAQSRAPQQGQAPRPSGNADMPRPVNEGDLGIERVVEVKKMAHPDTGEPYIGLFTMYGQNVGKFPEYKLFFSKESDVPHIADVDTNTGVKWQTQPVGTKIGKPFNVQYVLGKPKSGGNGQNRWHNLRAVLIGGDTRKPQHEEPEDESGIPW